MKKGFVDTVRHSHGDFLEYTPVEPERIDFLKNMLDTLGTRWLCIKGNENKTGRNFQDHCAQLILKLHPFIEKAGKLADKSYKSVLAGLDRTLTEATPFIRNPALMKKCGLGNLHLNLIFIVDDIKVIALRLLRNGASPVMPFQRWVKSSAHMDIWLRTLTGRPDSLCFGSRTRNGLRFYTDRLACIMPDEMPGLIAMDAASHSLTFDAYQNAAAEHNAYQKSIGEAELFQYIPEDRKERTKALRGYAGEQKLYRNVLAEVWKDLRRMQKEGYAYAGWARSYNYD